MRSAGQTPCQVHSKTVVKCIADADEVHSKLSSSAYTPKSSSKSSLQNPFSNPAPKAAAQGSGQGSKLQTRKDQQLIEVVNSSQGLVQLLKECCQEIGLERGKMSFEQSASNLQELVAEIPELSRGELLVSDLVWALDSEEWNRLAYSLGLRLSQRFGQRLKQELIVSLELRKQRFEDEWRRSPEGWFQRLLELGVHHAWREDVEAGHCDPNTPDSNLACLIWNLFPHHRCQFEEEGAETDDPILSCRPLSQFLADEEIDLLRSRWIEETRVGVSAPKACIPDTPAARCSMARRKKSVTS